MAQSNILILGASGQTGSETVNILATAGFPVRVTFREEKELFRLKGKYAEALPADYADAESLKNAMNGCERVFVIQPVTPNMVEHATNIYEAAKAASVSHIIRVSNMATGPDLGSDIARMHYEADNALKALGCSYTLLKGANYYQNMIYSALTIVRQQHFALPLGSTDLAQIDLRDISRVAAHCLVDNGHENKEYTLTGPEALTMNVVARKLSRIINKEIRYVGVEPVAAIQVFKDQGLPEWPAKAIGTMFMEYATGKYNFTTDDFEQVTGEKPRTIDAYLMENKESFLRERAISN
jgi:uncharacterized protein YbjT (DUF2867 family)